MPAPECGGRRTAVVFLLRRFMKWPASLCSMLRYPWSYQLFCGTLILIDTSHQLWLELSCEECSEGLSSLSDSLMQFIFGFKKKLKKKKHRFSGGREMSAHIIPFRLGCFCISSAVSEILLYFMLSPTETSSWGSVLCLFVYLFLFFEEEYKRAVRQTRRMC